MPAKFNRREIACGLAAALAGAAMPFGSVQSVFAGPIGAELPLKQIADGVYCFSSVHDEDLR